MFIYGISTNLLDTSTVLRVHFKLNQPYILNMRHGNQEKNYRVFQKNCAFSPCGKTIIILSESCQTLTVDHTNLSWAAGFFKNI